MGGIMPIEQDLFAEEQQMPTMSFGDHLEELRVRLLLALVGLIVGMIVTLVPPLNIGMLIMQRMQDPAQAALKSFYQKSAEARSEQAKTAEAKVVPVAASIPADAFMQQLRDLAPDAKWPAPEALEGRTLEFPLTLNKSEVIQVVAETVEPRNALIAITPLETVTIFLMVCLVSGLVLASPWVFYQIWAFIAAGLYVHERRYVQKFLPFSISLFLGGVFFCFFVVLPISMRVLLEFNIWLNIEPTLRISAWMGFATLLPLIFGLCFQTPLVMIFFARIGIFTPQQYRSQRKLAILIMVIIAAILTPDPTVISQILLAIPMIALYELGVFLSERSYSARQHTSSESRWGMSA